MTTSTSKDAVDLQMFLTQLAIEQGIVVGYGVDTYEDADVLGIPFLVVVTEDTLANGTVLFRDRDSCCCEQIHIAFVTRRLVHIFQRRDVEDTWTTIKKQLRSVNDE